MKFIRFRSASRKALAAVTCVYSELEVEGWYRYGDSNRGLVAEAPTLTHVHDNVLDPAFTGRSVRIDTERPETIRVQGWR